MSRCEMPGRNYAEVSDGIRDDGEFISWDSITASCTTKNSRPSFQGKTIIMVTHDPRAAERAKRVLHLEKGQLVREVA